MPEKIQEKLLLSPALWGRTICERESDLPSAWCIPKCSGQHSLWSYSWSPSSRWTAREKWYNAFPTVLHRIHEGNRLLSIHWKKITFQRMSADPGMVAHTWKPSTRFSSFGKEMEVWSEWFKLALRKQRQEIHYKVWGQSVIHRKFQTSQGYKVTNTLSQASKQQTHKQAE